jgi:hypothetical protein
MFELPVGIKDRMVWVGYKDFMDAIESYSIVVNGQSIYTQNYAIEESFITACATTDAVKRADVYSKARHSDIWKDADTFRSGTTVAFDDDDDIPAGEEFDVEIHLKIDIRRFLPLAAVKYLPKFVGNFELRVRFSPAGLVCAPLPIDDIFRDPVERIKFGDAQVTSNFVPIGTEFFMIGPINYGIGTTTAPSIEIITQTLTVSSFQVTTCFSVLSQFGLDANVYTALMARYSQTALAFPVQTLTFQPMNGSLREKLLVDLSLTTTPRFVDSIFILFPYNNLYRTCYHNPNLQNWSLKMGGYGQIPDVATDTYGPVFYEMCSNTLNTNNDSQGFNHEVERSLAYPGQQT